MEIVEFEPGFTRSLPLTHTLLRDAHLCVHPYVTRVVLHGSRGLAGNYRADSDVDLSLVVDDPASGSRGELERTMSAVLAVTRDHWQSPIDADLAVVFDVRNCGLVCFDAKEWNTGSCAIGGRDCFGLYKEQRGYRGLIWNAGVVVSRMCPCLTVWRRSVRPPEMGRSLYPHR